MMMACGGGSFRSWGWEIRGLFYSVSAVGGSGIDGLAEFKDFVDSETDRQSKEVKLAWVGESTELLPTQ